MSIDKWDRFQYLRMMFANGYKNARNLRDLIKHEFNAIDSDKRKMSDYLDRIKIVEATKKYEQYPASKWQKSDYDKNYDYYNDSYKESEETEKFNKMLKTWK